MTGRPTLLVTQRISKADGTFGGIIFAALDLQYFRSFYQGFEIGLNGSVTMFKSNGKVLVHRDDNDVGRDLSQTSLFTTQLKKAESGLYQISSPFDGLLKLSAYERLLDLPIVLSVGIPESEILVEWRTSRNRDFLITALMSAVLLLLSLVLVPQMRRRKRTEQLLAEREAGYRLLAENADDVVTRVGLDGIRRYVSPSIEKLTGWTADDVVGRSAFEFTHPNHRPILHAAVNSLTSDQPSTILEYLTLRKDGSSLWVETRFNLVFDHTGSPAEVIAIIRDISERKVAEELLLAANEQLKALSETDALTGISNRRRFDEMFEKERRRVQRSRGALSILFIDIDMFKAFNDTYGHTAGDDCLRRVAQALLQNLRRAGDLVARYGGEEFAVILPETSLLDAIVVAENLLRAMRELNIEHEKSAKGYVSISIGVAGEVLNFSVDGTNLLQEADAALYRAKDAGRDRVCTSTSSRLQPRLAN